MIRAVIGTNILVSGLLFGGLTLRVIRAAMQLEFHACTSLILIEESERVLRSKKFGLSLLEVEPLFRPFIETTHIVSPLGRFEGVEILNVRQFLDRL